jgi:mono/diheme cytochrome c family protein
LVTILGPPQRHKRTGAQRGLTLQTSWWLIAASLIALSVPVLADDAGEGRAAYLQNCAACHGANGKGAGPASVRLRIKPADLTILAKRNNGVYSRPAVYDMVDGRKAVRAHRESGMPIWGCRQAPPAKRKEKAKELDSLLDLPCDSESVIRARLESIVDYLGLIQAK